MTDQPKIKKSDLRATQQLCFLPYDNHTLVVCLEAYQSFDLGIFVL